jgi:hypothetical protein
MLCCHAALPSRARHGRDQRNDRRLSHFAQLRVRAGAVNNTLNLTLGNVGTAADTYSINVAPVGNSPAPALSTNTVRLDTGGTQQIAVTLSAGNLEPGEYQGYLQIAGATGSSVAAIPYWYGVPGPDPNGISILWSDQGDYARTFSSEAVVFRIVDIAGLP